MKPTKMNFQDLNRYGGYYKYSRVKTKGGEKGYLYYLSQTLTETEKKEITTNYNNTDLFITSPEYAPEIKHTAVLIYDKAIYKNQRL